MSSCIFLNLDQPISQRQWQVFCNDSAIVYSPRTVGRNVYYHDDVEISFGESSFQSDNPPDEAQQITFSTYYGGNLKGTSDLAKKFIRRYPCTYPCSPEFTPYMEEVSDCLRQSQE